MSSQAHRLAETLIRKRSDMPSLTLARVLAKEHPKVFNLESARSMVRYLRGNMGARTRKQAEPDLKLPNGTSGADPFERMPKGRYFKKGRPTPFQISGPCKALILSDVHVPFHDYEALKIAIQRGIDEKVDVVLLNGDFLDMYAESRFMKDPEQVDLADELSQGRGMLAFLREKFPAARIVFKYGNHDERWENSLKERTPELWGVDDFRLEKLLRCEEYGVEAVKDKRLIRLGKLNVLHGHEYGKGGASSPVNPARGYYLKTKVNTLVGHLHQASTHTEPNLEGHTVTVWSVGCLCYLWPEYAVYNKWSLGFALVRVEANGAFDVQNLRIIDGKAY